MRRYLITNKLRKTVINNPESMREISRILGFEVKNIVHKNFSIREDHVAKLSAFFNNEFVLKEIHLDYGKNLGKNAFTQPIKKVNKNGNLSELIGIMLGDGNLFKNQIKISFDRRHNNYISYVRNLFKAVFGIDLRLKLTKNTNQANLYCYNKFVAQRLIDFGLSRGHKIKNNVGIPNWIKQNQNYSRRCLKGLIDTDGCIYFSKRDKQIYIKFTNFNKKLLEDFKELTLKLDYHFARANKNNWCLYRKIEVAKFFKDIKPFKFKVGLWGSLD